MRKPTHPKPNRLPDQTDICSSRGRTMTAEKDIEAVLGSVTNLPLRYWKEKMFFRGLPDKSAFQLTAGQFPVRPTSGSHPVFSLKALPEKAGFRVCPCSSKRPFSRETCRFIGKGCLLLHTGFAIDRDSFLIEKFQFNIPRSQAHRLRFLGEVPEECLRHG